VLDFFIGTAYAGTAKQFAAILQQVIDYAKANGMFYTKAGKLTRIGRALRDSLDELNTLTTDNQLSSYKFTLKGLRVMAKIYDVADKEGLEAFVRFGRYSGIDKVRKFDEVLTDLDNLTEVDKLKFVDIGERGLRDVFTDAIHGLGASNPKWHPQVNAALRAGSSHHLHLVSKTPAATIKGIEKTVPIKNVRGEPLGEIRADIYTTSDEILDAKAWNPTLSNLKSKFKKHIEFAEDLDPQDLQDVLPGQIYKYIVHLHTQGNANKVQLWFDARSKDQVEVIKKALMEVLTNANANTRNRFLRDLGLVGPGTSIPDASKVDLQVVWNRFVVGFKDTKLDNFIKVLE
jgi:hypothetical protein